MIDLKIQSFYFYFPSMSLENLKLKLKFSVSSVQVDVILSTEYTLIEKIDSRMLKMKTFYDYVEIN